MRGYNISWTDIIYESLLPEVENAQRRIRERYADLRADIEDCPKFELPQEEPRYGYFLEVNPREAVIDLLSDDWGDTAVFEERVNVNDREQTYKAWLDIYYQTDNSSLTGSFCLYSDSLPNQKPLPSNKADQIEEEMRAILNENDIDLVEFNNGV